MRLEILGILLNCQFLLHKIRKLHELLNAQLLWTLCHQLMLEELWPCYDVTVEYLPERYSEHLPTLVEGGLHYPLEKSIITSEIRYLVARHADNRTLNLWRWVEHMLINGKEILCIIPSLYQHR